MPTPATPEPSPAPSQVPTPAPSENVVGVSGTLEVLALPDACADEAFFEAYERVLTAVIDPLVDVAVGCDEYEAATRLRRLLDGTLLRRRLQDDGTAPGRRLQDDAAAAPSLVPTSARSGEEIRGGTAAA